jgi:hypothetical protein
MGDIQKSSAAEIIRLHNEIINSLKMSLHNAIRIGELLSEQKASLKHGKFTPWIKGNLPFTDRTARNYMRVYRERDRLKTETVSDLKSAYRLLEMRKSPQVVSDKSKPDEADGVTFFDYDTTCMRVSKEIQDECPDAILHPIKMDSISLRWQNIGNMCH